MLRNVLEDYLNSINERDFDYPLSSLLQAMEFYDVHLTHGKTEFGKDFIAKKIEEGIVYQYAIQSKKGDIKQGQFRNEIMGQLMEASLLGIVHPQFDRSLPRKVIFATTGRLRDNAGPAFQDMNLELTTTYGKNPVTFWGHERIIELSEEFGLSGIHKNTVEGLRGFAQFYVTYSKALEGSLSDREAEEYSRHWLDDSLAYKKRIFRAAIEAEIIAGKLVETGHTYEAISVYLGLARIVMSVSHDGDDGFTTIILKETVESRILPLSKRFFNQLKVEWEEAGDSLLSLCFKESFFPMVHYLVWCSRVLETAALFFFLATDQTEKKEISSFIVKFIEKEEGCGHIPGDRYAVSLVWVALALIQSGRTVNAREITKRSVMWLCDRVEQGFGIASYDADEKEETYTLLGYPFESIKVEKNTSSFLASIAADLAAFMEDKEFYADIVNDFEACDVVYNYWQFPDSAAIFTIDTEECVTYPNIPHQYVLTKFDDFAYAEHIKHERESFSIVERNGTNSLILLSVLLKDRYFPKMWKQIVEGETTK